MKALIILESANGARLVSKYYCNEPSFNSKQRQEAFEAKLFNKTKNQPLGALLYIIIQYNISSHYVVLTLFVRAAEIVIIDEYAAIYKSSGDLTFFVIGAKSENELLLLTILNVFRESMDVLLRFVSFFMREVEPFA